MPAALIFAVLVARMAASPQRVVLMSAGRSGSTITGHCLREFSAEALHGKKVWSDSGRLSSLKTAWATRFSQFESHWMNEILGSGPSTMLKLKNPKRTVANFFKTEEQIAPNLLNGFKWKPYVQNKAYDEALAWLARNGVRVVFMTRNPFDVYLSNIKHGDKLAAAPTKHARVPAHCEPDDAKCLEAMLEFDTCINVSDALLRITEKRNESAVALQKLQHFGVLTHKTTYEALFAANHSTQLLAWKAVMAFVQPARNFSGLTKDRIQQGTADFTVKTSTSHQRDSITNWAEVTAAFRAAGPQFARLLH